MGVGCFWQCKSEELVCWKCAEALQSRFLLHRAGLAVVTPCHVSCKPFPFHSCIWTQTNSFALVVGILSSRLLWFVLFQPATCIRALVNGFCIRALWIAYILFLNSVISTWKFQKDEESLLGWWFRRANLLQPKYDLLPWTWTEAVPVFWYFTWLGFRTVCAPGRVQWGRKPNPWVLA